MLIQYIHPVLTRKTIPKTHKSSGVLIQALFHYVTIPFILGFVFSVRWFFLKENAPHRVFHTKCTSLALHNQGRQWIYFLGGIQVKGGS